METEYATIIRTKNFRKFGFPMERNRYLFGLIPGRWRLVGRPRQFFHSASDYDIKHSMYCGTEHPLEMELDEEVSDIVPNIYRPW